MADTLEDDIEDALEAMVARHAINVPPYPAVALRLTELVRRESYGLAEVVPLVSGDPTLAANLLRCANSSVYARGVEVTSLPQAITRLGAHAVVRMAITSALASTVLAAGPLQPLKRVAWQASVASAIVCQDLADARGLSSDEAFLCGLLHDYGQLIALASLDEIIAAMPEVSARPVAFWRAIVERVHVKLGLLLVSRWSLPTLFRDVIALHHDRASRGNGPNAPFVDVVAVSDQVVSVIATRAHVDVASLGSIGRLTTSEREKLAASIVGVPSVIASFEGDTRGPVSASLVTGTASIPPDGFRPLRVPIELKKPRRRGPYVMRSIAGAGWLMAGPEPIALNTLIEVTIRCAPDPVTLWAQVTSCVDGSDGATIECKPFAVSSAVLSRLGSLYRDAAA